MNDRFTVINHKPLLLHPAVNRPPPQLQCLIHYKAHFGYQALFALSITCHLEKNSLSLLLALQMSEKQSEDASSLGGSHVKFQVDPSEEDARSHRGQELRHFMMSGIKFERDNTEKLREFQMKGAYWWMQNFAKASLTWQELPLVLRLVCHTFWATLLPNEQVASDFDKAAADFEKSKPDLSFDELDTSQKEILYVMAHYLHEEHYTGLDTKESEAAEESLAAINLTIPTVVNASFHD
jgi:hypothetical protein